MKYLGIETSCDETGVAVYCSDKGLLAHALYSQIKLHAEYGGVVPELASRDHIRKLLPLIEQVFADTGITKDDIDGIAYTAGPGLVGALLVGASVARSLAFAWGVRCLGVHHMEGHLMSPMLEEDAPEFPFIAFLVSGGHTMLIEVQGMGQYKLLGESIDDAVGEAFDKTAKVLGLGYPGGPALANLAEQGEPTRFTFPRPMLNRPGLDLSFSGLKTFALNTFQESDQSEQTKADIARAFEDAVVDTLAKKCERAIKQTGLTRLVVSGGVSANKQLRARLTALLENYNGRAYFPRLELCTDNGAMIAYVGAQRMARGEHDDLTIIARPRWPMEALR